MAMAAGAVAVALFPIAVEPVAAEAVALFPHAKDSAVAVEPEAGSQTKACAGALDKAKNAMLDMRAGTEVEALNLLIDASIIDAPKFRAERDNYISKVMPTMKSRALISVRSRIFVYGLAPVVIPHHLGTGSRGEPKVGTELKSAS